MVALVDTRWQHFETKYLTCSNFKCLFFVFLAFYLFFQVNTLKVE